MTDPVCGIYPYPLEWYCDCMTDHVNEPNKERKKHWPKVPAETGAGTGPLTPPVEPEPIPPSKPIIPLPDDPTPSHPPGDPDPPNP
jgi:hypothetical protein